MPMNTSLLPIPKDGSIILTSLRRAVAFQNRCEKFYPVRQNSWGQAVPSISQRQTITSRRGNASTSVWTAIRSVV